MDVYRKSEGQTSRRVTYRNLGGNSWRMDFEASDTSVLCDPWLVGSLTFGGLPWLYEGKKDTSGLGMAAADGTDILLLSQGLDDHAHVPTLQLLPKSLPVIASPTAAEVATKLGFTQVVSLAPGKTWIQGNLAITATEGALVGPPWSQRENGFIIREKCDKGVSVYYEPHASFDGSDLARADDVDMVISPAAEIKMLGYPLVNGFDETRKLLKLLRPQVLMPLANGAIDQGGIIASAVVQTGSLATLERDVAASGLDVKFLSPPAIGEEQLIELD